MKPEGFIAEVEQTENTEASDRGGFLQERPEITCGLHPPGLSWATCVLRSPLPGFPPYASYYISVVGPTLMVWQCKLLLFFCSKSYAAVVLLMRHLEQDKSDHMDSRVQTNLDIAESSLQE
ncbi:hypothetical protein NC652_023237 [Populus alba x Populus x berolinensis]|nr:hypothetical protein NC652_023237 [Populus alba x Populus x berolinensis]